MQNTDTYPARPLRIGEVAELFGVTVPTVRNWERSGKIASVRTPGNQRRFLAADVQAFFESPDATKPGDAA